jgi:hypothetical protein
MELSRDELEILNNALNEVCHGLDIDEFSIRIGAEKPEVLRLLHRISAAMQQLE